MVMLNLMQKTAFNSLESNRKFIDGNGSSSNKTKFLVVNFHITHVSTWMKVYSVVICKCLWKTFILFSKRVSFYTQCLDNNQNSYFSISLIVSVLLGVPVCKTAKSVLIQLLFSVIKKNLITYLALEFIF